MSFSLGQSFLFGEIMIIKKFTQVPDDTFQVIWDTFDSLIAITISTLQALLVTILDTIGNFLTGDLIGNPLVVVFLLIVIGTIYILSQRFLT